MYLSPVLGLMCCDLVGVEVLLAWGLGVDSMPFNLP